MTIKTLTPNKYINKKKITEKDFELPFAYSYFNKHHQLEPLSVLLISLTFFPLINFGQKLTTC